MRILELLRGRFESGLRGWIEDSTSHAQRVAMAREAKLGDYQANIAMGLAGVLGQKPQEVAREIVDRVALSDLCESVEIAGPGFINMRLKDAWICQQLSEMLSDERLGVQKPNHPRRYVIDFSSPNVAKPMHVGHIRSTVIGDAISRSLRFLGHTVVTDNHLGDWGTQFGMVIYGYKHFRDQKAFDADPVQELGRLYRVVQQLIAYQSAVGSIEAKRQELAQKISFLEQSKNAAAQNPADKKLAKAIKANERGVEEAQEKVEELLEKIQAVQADSRLLAFAESHPGLDRRVLEETALLHEGDAENNRLWNQFLPYCIQELHRIYDRLGVSFDHEYGESFYHPMLGKVVQGLVDSGLAKESDGAICVFLEDYDAPMIIRKQDGAFLYATSDIATVQFRLESFQPDAILYVVDHRQSEHFQKLFQVLRKMGIDQVELNHVQFGTVLGNDGKPFKTRSGSVVGLDYLLDEAVQAAWKVVCNPDRVKSGVIEQSEAEKRNVAQVVGMGAIKYADLMHNRTSDYEFDIDKMVQLDGNTSAYIQYSYTRTRAILEKSELQFDAKWLREVEFKLGHSAERDLALQLIRFEDMLVQSMEEYYPSLIAAYLYDLAKLFASFYDQCPVLIEEDPAIRSSRLGLVMLVGKTIRQGLDLLGIGTVERM